MKSMEDEGHFNASPARVLLVEDSAGDASLVMSSLSGAINLFEVRWVSTLAGAVAELLSSHYECLLVDLGLPDGDGLAVVDALREAAKDSAFVVLTGRADDELGVLAIQHGADDYFLKSELSIRGVHRSISYAIERTRLRAHATRMSARADAVMTSLGDGVVVLDSDGVVVSANPAATRILGGARDELVGLTIPTLPCDLFHPDGSPLDFGEVSTRQTLESQEPLRGVTRGVRRSDGTVSWIEVNIQPLRTRDDMADGVVISIHDITERLAAGEAARFQAALLASVGQAVIAIDPQGLIVYWNKAAEDMYGWSESEALGQPLAVLVPSESPETVRELVRASMEGIGWSGDFLVHRRDGTIFPVLVTETPMFDEHGELSALIGVSTDISERKRAEDAAQKLSVIVESTADAILTIDLDGTILTWNTGAEELYGHPANEAIGKNMCLLDADAEAEERLSAMRTIIGTGQSIRDMELVRRRRDGSLVDVSLSGSPIYTADGIVMGIASIGRDISDRKRLEQELSRQAVHDALTGLPNRVLLADRLSQALAGAARRDAPVSVLFLDLDQFKSVNDANGHLIGDDLLVQVAARLQSAVRPSDTLARFGGDEFVVVCEDADVAEAQRIAERLAAALKVPIELSGTVHHVSVSIGIATSPPIDADAHTLLRYADTAMYDAKARGRARSRVFDASLATESKDRLELTNDLGNALREDALEVHYQPVIDLATGLLVGLEALTRWHHPVRGWIPPTIFVPLAEECGLIADFDRWVLNRACRDGADLRSTGLLPSDGLLSVNISARNVADLSLVDVVREAAADSTFPLEALELEVTETAIMAEVPTIRLVLEGVRKLGVGIALDDFGTGYSSLTFVKQLPVTTIKIDCSFTRHVATNPQDLAIATSVIDLARAVGLRTIAEGVEDFEQVSVLHRLGCEAGQGYLWSSALPMDLLSARLRRDPQDFACATKAPRRRSGELQGSVRSVPKQRRKATKIA
jgi:diguanylate cyclase (GGDEF)-like protein/PAS domain S-box-containing protein